MEGCNSLGTEGIMGECLVRGEDGKREEGRVGEGK